MWAQNVRSAKKDEEKFEELGIEFLTKYLTKHNYCEFLTACRFTGGKNREKWTKNKSKTI